VHNFARLVVVARWSVIVLHSQPDTTLPPDDGGVMLGSLALI